MRRWIVRLAWAYGLYIVFSVAAVGVAWWRAYDVPWGPATTRLALDLRTDQATPGRTVTIKAKRPQPDVGDFIGHLWIGWPETLPGAEPGTTSSGYYAMDQAGAAVALAKAILAPWGVLTGQPPIPGSLLADDAWAGHVEVHVTVDEATYRAAVAVDARWREEDRYVLRPGALGMGPARTYACHDYALDVAEALGLQPVQSSWANFPMGHFRALADANGISGARRPA
jgi:hypothetical protein